MRFHWDTAIILAASMVLAGCSTKGPIGEWNMPGVGFVDLDGSIAVQKPPTGPCGWDHCSHLTVSVPYEVRKDGPVYVLSFSQEGRATGLRNGYVARNVENDPYPVNVAPTRWRRIDACTFMELGKQRLMWKKAEGCPVRPASRNTISQY